MQPDRGIQSRLISSSNVFTNSLLVIFLTILGVYCWGVGQHHTFFENSLFSTTILSVSFFLFITIGLYRGHKLKDELGEITGELKFRKLEVFSDLPSPSGMDFDGGDEGCLGILAAIILWMLAAVALALVIWIFGNLLVGGITAFVGMLYWIFFRALRLVFKHSHKCKNNLASSMKTGLYYTFLYNFWIYGIFVILRLLPR